MKVERRQIMRHGKWTWAALRAARHRTGAANLIVTRRCDLACGYCSARSGGKEIPPEDWIRIARLLGRRFSVFTVSGGEPLLYEGLPDLVNGLSRMGIAGLCTNAKILDEWHLQAMEGLDYLNFSIDHTGGSDVSEKTGFGKLELMSRYAKRNSFELFGTAVITSRNVDSIPLVVRELSKYGIRTNLQFVQGRGAPDAFDTPGKISDLERLQRELLGMKHAGYPIDESDAYISGFVSFARGERTVTCHAGDTYLAVDTDGRLMPCQDGPAVGRPFLDEADTEGALRRLPKAAPIPCRCWWNCYHRYECWRRSPWRFIVGSMADRFRPLARGTRSKRDAPESSAARGRHTA